MYGIGCFAPHCILIAMIIVYAIISVVYLYSLRSV